jgi:hypothetical protein
VSDGERHIEGRQLLAADLDLRHDPGHGALHLAAGPVARGEQLHLVDFGLHVVEPIGLADVLEPVEHAGFMAADEQHAAEQTDIRGVR